MYFVRYFVIFISLTIFGCGEMTDDLNPSGDDRRPAVVADSTGAQVGQIAPDFTVSDSLGNSITMSAELAAADAAVLYFTMWCPVCDSHQSHMLSFVTTRFPDVNFYLVDYVNNSVAAARNAETSNGYAGSVFTVLADTDNSILNSFGATMSTTVVIDSSGTVRMNEDYKDGSRLIDTLEALP